MSTLRAVCENPTLHEIHRSKISLHQAKANYSYPTIRLPHSFSKLAGLQTRIFQTVHGGELAFLVVVLPRPENPEISARPPYLHGEGRRFKFGRAHSFFFQSDAKIKATILVCLTDQGAFYP
jgi:hypothetical protein